MQWDQVEENWTDFKKHIRQHFAKLTDNQLDAIGGKRDHLAGRIQVMYGIDRQEAEHQLDDWLDKQNNIDGHLYQSQPFSRIDRY